MIIKLMWLWWHQQQPQQDFRRIMRWWWCELNSNWTLSISLTFWISTQCAHAHACNTWCAYDIIWWIFALLSYERTCFCWRLQHIAWMWFQIYAYRFWFFFLNFEWHISFKWLGSFFFVGNFWYDEIFIDIRYYRFEFYVIMIMISDLSFIEK